MQVISRAPCHYVFSKPPPGPCPKCIKWNYWQEIATLLSFEETGEEGNSRIHRLRIDIIVETLTTIAGTSWPHYLEKCHSELPTMQQRGYLDKRFPNKSKVIGKMVPTPGPTKSGVQTHAYLQPISSLQTATTESSALDVFCPYSITIIPAQYPYKLISGINGTITARHCRPMLKKQTNYKRKQCLCGITWQWLHRRDDCHHSANSMSI